MDPNNPEIAEWQSFGEYTVSVYGDLGVNVEAYISRSSKHLGFGREKLDWFKKTHDKTANIYTHNMGITLEETDANMGRIYELLADAVGLTLRDSGITQRGSIDPSKLKNENIGLAERVLRDARAYKIIYPNNKAT